MTSTIHAQELTATPNAFTFQMIKTVLVGADPALERRYFIGE